MKNRKLYNILFASLLFVFGLFTLNSCVDDTDDSTLEPSRYTAEDVQSYADLFQVFWTVMDQKYNYFNEQPGKSWRTIYNEYYPKFKELETYIPNDTHTRTQIQEDQIKAEKYFSEIINPIIDRHFYVTIQMPTGHSYIRKVTFYGGMLNDEEDSYSYNFESKYKFMKNKLDVENGVFSEVKPFSFWDEIMGLSKYDMLGSYLKDNPDIYYFAFNQFMLSSTYQINFRDYKYLNVDTNNKFYFTKEDIINSSLLAAIPDPETRKDLLDKSIEYYDKYNSFLNSSLVQQTAAQLEQFKIDEIVTEEFFNNAAEIAKTAPNLSTDITAIQKNKLFTSNEDYMYWFLNNWVGYVQKVCELDVFIADISDFGTNKAKRDYYMKFLNPLKRGDIKKIIIDLRGNGGGAVIDARHFTDRFITKEAVYAYQRKKENNNPFGYTPWAPAVTRVTDKSIGRDIPIAVLLDRGSASMSEISTLMIKSQGSLVSVIGEYSAGATAGLGDSDRFNGGITEAIAGGLITFNMPLLALQDANRNVIESTGIKPDYLMDKLTIEEYYEMAYYPDTHVDRTLQKAIEVLQTK